MKISFEAIGQQYVTFLAGVDAAEGKVCKVGGNSQVTGCGAGERFCGVVTELRGGAAAVLSGGYCELPYSGADPQVGYGKLAASADGGVQTDANGGEYLIVNVDTAGKTVGLFL